ncbi:hypothetical protein L7F22_025506 [Adiantum nelumboides]|nr:hypothetical protein [Adiantum nelumboides]
MLKKVVQDHGFVSSVATSKVQTSGSNKGCTHYLHELGNAVRICKEVSRRSDGSFSTTLQFMRWSVKLKHRLRASCENFQDGKFMVGCLNYPHCRNAVWLPNALLEASVSAEICTTCGPGAVYRIHFKFKQGEIPPQYAIEYTGCVGGCDAILKELIEICGTGLRSLSGTTQVNRGVNNVQANFRTNQRGASQNQRMAPNSADPVMCHCQQPCLLLTAQTESNRGRQFYRCSSSNACDFFLWEATAEAHGNVPDISANTNNAWQEQRRTNMQPRVGRNTQASRGRTSAGRGGAGRRTRADTGGAFIRATGEAITQNSCYVWRYCTLG